MQKLVDHSPSFCLCCKTAPRPLLLASQLILVSLFLLKCDNSTFLLTSLLIPLNAFSFSTYHIQPASFSKIILYGKLIVGNFGINLLNSLTAPKNERSCFKFVGLNLSVNSCAFAFTGKCQFWLICYQAIRYCLGLTRIVVPSIVK